MTSISPDLWKRIEPILAEALELEGEARSRYLERVRARDKELVSQVELLLAADSSAEHLLSRPLSENDLTLFREALEQPGAATPVGSSTTTGPESRYAPGALIGDRFRIQTWIGRGGMGEVYRADDLKLGQPVALKFLPEDAERDQDRLERFFNEVRMALKVSHPNVTRIHDIGETGGQHYISMEYVDGEDLASLLRRIGRLPRDKALEVARQLCAGLAAAHDRDVLHRDLKPANVMIDGSGQVKITDFGLAAFDQTVRGAEAIAGTPAYMAPEQWSGGEVTRRSDIYSLGLLLYELFTGTGAFAAQSPEEIAAAQRSGSASAPDPSSIVEGLDPAVERVILQCLEQQPSARPRSALAVAAALPGGDPLAAALAAGETPSPGMVARAAPKSGLARRFAWPALAGVLLLLGSAMAQAPRFQLSGLAALTTPPQVLAYKADETLAALGYAERNGDRLSFFAPDFAYLRHIERTDRSPDRWHRLRSSQPAAYRFWVRQSPAEMVRLDPASVDGRRLDPPLTTPGMVELALDTEGRLVALNAVPDRLAAAADPVAEADWGSLFEAAALDLSRFQPADPLWEPPVFADLRRAWVGVFPEAPEIALRVEAASTRGRPVAFHLLAPWDLSSTPTAETTVTTRPLGFLWSAAFFAALVGAAFAAAANVRRRRGDLQTARRLAILVFALRFSHLFAARHFASRAELDLLAAHLAQALLWGGTVWLYYVAVEPYARRVWPRMLTSWVRLFDGQLRDSLVGRDLLLGALAGLINANVRLVTYTWATPRLGDPPTAPTWSAWTDIALDGVPSTLAAIAALGSGRIRFALGIVVLLTIARLLTRRTWIALGLVALIPLLASLPGADNPTLYFAAFSISLGLGFLVLVRVGLLAFVTLQCVVQIVWHLPLTTDVSAWYFGTSLTVLAFLLGLAGWGFYHCIWGRSMTGDPVVVASRPS